MLTVEGERLWWELNGDPVLPIQTERPAHKVLSRGGSLGEKTADPGRVTAWLARNAERLVEELEHYLVAAGRLDLLMEAGRHCVSRAWDGRRPVNRMHLFATDLRRPGCVRRGLFEPPEGRARVIARLKREVNARVGRFALRSGATLPLDDVYRDAAQSFDVCDVRGKQCF